MEIISAKLCCQRIGRILNDTVTFRQFIRHQHNHKAYSQQQLVYCLKYGGKKLLTLDQAERGDFAIVPISPESRAMGMLRQKNAFRVAVGLHGEGCDWPMVRSLEVARGPIPDETQRKGPTLSSLLSKFSDPKEQGVVFGMYHGLSSLARVAGPIIAGLTYPLWRNTGPFLTSGVIVLVVAVWTIAVKAQARRHGQEASPGFEVLQREEAIGRAATTEIE